MNKQMSAIANQLICYFADFFKIMEYVTFFFRNIWKLIFFRVKDSETFGYSPFRDNAAVDFFLFLAPSGALTLRGQLPNPVGQSPNPI